MKKLITLLFVVTAFGQLSAQRKYPAFLDAVRLNNCINTSTGVFKEDSLKTVAGILNNYLPVPKPEGTTNSSILLSYTQPASPNYNIFLKDMIPAQQGSAGAERFNPSGTSVPGLSGINVPVIADGIAKFLVERFKEEMVYTFLEKFQKIMKENPEYELLFPSTVNAIRNIESFKVKEILPSLRDEFKSDISTLYLRLPAILESERFAELFKYKPVTDVIRLAFKIINPVAKGEHISEVLQDLSDLKQASYDSSLHNVTATVKMLGILSESLRSSDSNEVWVSTDSLMEHFPDTIFSKIYTGLLFQRVRGIEVDTKTGTKRLDDTSLVKKDTYLRIRTTVTSLSFLLHDVKELAEEIESDTARKIDNYVEYIDKSASLIKNHYHIVELFSKKPITDSTLLLTVDLISNITGLYTKIKEKQYVSAVAKVYLIFRDIMQLSGKKSNDKAELFVAQFFKYAQFMAAVVEAKTSDEVKEAIKSVVLPPGSSLSKTYSTVSIALNGYVGINAGHDFGSVSTDVFNTAGIWAPIGVSVNFGGWKHNKFVGTLGVNVTIIDLGALVSFRWDDDSTETLPQFNARNLLAPGVYFTMGRLFNTPLTLGFGGQYGPQLRALTSTGADVVDNAWRVNVTLSCDIPFFYLYRKSRRR